MHVCDASCLMRATAQQRKLSARFYIPTHTPSWKRRAWWWASAEVWQRRDRSTRTPAAFTLYSIYKFISAKSNAAFDRRRHRRGSNEGECSNELTRAKERDSGACVCLMRGFRFGRLRFSKSWCLRDSCVKRIAAGAFSRERTRFGVFNYTLE